MIKPLENQQKISLLVITEIILIFFAMIGFSLSVVFSIVRMQHNIQETYIHPITVNNAGLDVYTNLSHIHNQMTQLMLSDEVDFNEKLDKEIAGLDVKLRNSFNIIKVRYQGDAGKVLDIERQLDNWKIIRTQMVNLVRQGRKDQALMLASKVGMPVYHQLENSLSQVVNSSQQYVDTLIAEANRKSADIMVFVWWLLGGFIITTVISGAMVIRKISKILEQGRQAERKLHESEERMKLALSGADIGTWDLDISTGRLDFDSQWGGLLNYIFEKDRPHNMQEWASLIHPEDKERVLKTMQDHIDGLTLEYKAEYRISSRSGKLKWVAGHGKAVSRDQNGKALRVVGITRDITTQKQAEDTIWKLAHTDSLTGLPNRALFNDRLGQSIAQAKRQSKKLALLFLDLDDFKLANDKFGHDTGDALLKEVAERLRQNIRSENTVARTGGDEFIFILSDIENIESAAVVAKKIIQSISEPFVINGNTCQIGSSIGISIYPDDSDHMEKLITQADGAMYKAKERGKNTYCFFASNV